LPRSAPRARRFAAFMPSELTAPLVEAEQQRSPRFRDPKIVDDARQRGFTAVEGTLVPGVSAVSVSVFDNNNKIAGVIGALGRTEEIDTVSGGKVMKALLRGAAVSHGKYRGIDQGIAAADTVLVTGAGSIASGFSDVPMDFRMRWFQRGASFQLEA
jgi:hypothetical protein